MRVLHIVGSDQRRGAEIFANDLARSLAVEVPSQRIDTIDGHAIAEVRSIVGWRPDLIHAHGGGALRRGVAASSLSLHRPRLVYRRIGSVQHLVRERIRRAAYGWLMRRAHRIVAVSEAVRDETIDFFRVRPERIVLIPNGVDPVRLEPVLGRDRTREILGIRSDVPVVLSLGALTWEKDPLAHLEVSKRAFEEIPEAIHLFVGDGPLRLRLEAVAASRSLGERVRVLGERSDVGDLLAASDVVLLASRTEGMPACLIEAGMARLPVAAYSMAGVPEVVEDRVTGFLAPKGDVGELARFLTKLLGDAELRHAMGAAARDRCFDRFHIEQVAAKYLRLYEEIVA
jgi:glycosyltransferase involved in cell wall biosynthesis